MNGFYATIAALGAALLVAAQPAAAADTAVTPLHLDGKATGATFEGVGVVDGGGATSVLLKDYPEPQRRQILDLVYKPKFGASVSALYVEIPGDGNSTQGSMPSHMHSRDDLDYGRGYIWWVMTEARRRNPRLSLDGAAWSAPGWVGDRGARYGRADEPFFSQDGVDYYIAWLKGLRDVHGLTLDAMGLRNEKGVSYDFAKAMRQALNANGFAAVRLHGFDNWQDDRFDFVTDMARDGSLRAALDIASAHVSPVEGTKVSPEVKLLAAQMSKPLWNTEQHVYQAGYEGLLNTVKSFNEGYITDGFTRITDWYGIAGLYTMEPYSGEKEALVRANWPWSGRYIVNPKLWAYAHYGQFTEIGWTYLAGGSGPLKGGGTFVALKSSGNDYSIVIETADAKKPSPSSSTPSISLQGRWPYGEAPPPNSSCASPTSRCPRASQPSGSSQGRSTPSPRPADSRRGVSTPCPTPDPFLFRTARRSTTMTSPRDGAICPAISPTSTGRSNWRAVPSARVFAFARRRRPLPYPGLPAGYPTPSSGTTSGRTMPSAPTSI